MTGDMLQEFTSLILNVELLQEFYRISQQKLTKIYTVRHNEQGIVTWNARVLAARGSPIKAISMLYNVYSFFETNF